MPDVAFDPRPRPAPGTLGAGGPRYQVQISDLYLLPYTHPCPVCGRGKPALDYRVPPGMEGTGTRRTPDVSAIAGFLAFVRPHSDGQPCSRCRLLGHLGRLFARPTGPIIESPADRSIRELTEALTAATAPPPAAPPTYEGALFSPGVVRVTSSAGFLLARRGGRLDFTPGIDALAADEFAPEFVGRHVRGDHGHIGQAADGDADLAERTGPLSSVADRNAHAIRSGAGSIKSVFPITREAQQAWGAQVIERTELRIWSELDAGVAITLLHTPADLSE